jgi:hypothetical protein
MNHSVTDPTADRLKRTKADISKTVVINVDFIEGPHS